MSPWFAEVIPLLRLPRSLEVFDYEIPKDLQKTLRVGQVVRTLFRGQRVDGIIANLKQKTEYKKIQPIIKILDDSPLIPPATLSLFQTMARDACVSAGLFLRSVLPETPKRTITPLIKSISKPKTPSVSKSVAEKLGDILKNIRSSKKLSILADSPEFTKNLLIRLALDALERQKPLLILFPIQEQAAECLSLFQSHRLAAALTLPADAKGKTYAVWRAFEAGTCPIIIGTRNATFFPMKKGGRYVLIDETAEEWKQSDINPRLDARRILLNLAQHHQAQLLTITSMRDFTTGDELTSCDARILTPPDTLITQFNWKDILSERLCEFGENAKNILLFTHRKGAASLLRCTDCHYTATCPSCELSLAVHQNFLRCPACGAQSDMPLSCPKCGGTKLTMLGLGADQVAEVAKKQFPHATITVTTTSFLNTWSLITHPPPFDLVAIVEADGLLHRPDFRAQEKLARIVNRLGIIATLNQSPFIIQTQFPNLPVWRAAEQNHDSFYESLHQERQGLNYPPSHRLVKLIFQHEDEKTARAQAQDVVKKLQAIPDINISEPYNATPPKIRNKYHVLISLTFKPENYKRIHPHLFNLPDDIVVDLDATDILK